MDAINKEELLFYITKEDVQYEAVEKIGRELTEAELYKAKKGLEWGLTTDIDTIYDTILSDILSDEG